MELKKKFKILSWSMILLILFNVTILITIFAHRQYNNKNCQPNNSDCFNGQQHQNNPHKEGHFKSVIISELDLDDNQIVDFEKFRQNFIRKSHIYFDSIRFYNDIIDQELSQEIPNNQIIELNAEKIGDFHSKLKLNFVDYFVNIRSILNKNQHDKFHEILINFKQQKQRQMNKPHYNQKH